MNQSDMKRALETRSILLAYIRCTWQTRRDGTEWTSCCFMDTHAPTPTAYRYCTEAYILMLRDPRQGAPMRALPSQARAGGWICNCGSQVGPPRGRGRVAWHVCKSDSKMRPDKTDIVWIYTAPAAGNGVPRAGLAWLGA